MNKKLKSIFDFRNFIIGKTTIITSLGVNRLRGFKYAYIGENNNILGSAVCNINDANSVYTNRGEVILFENIQLSDDVPHDEFLTEKEYYEKRILQDNDLLKFLKTLPKNLNKESFNTKLKIWEDNQFDNLIDTIING